MKEIINWMIKQFGLTPRDAQSLWNMMVVDGKSKGVDLNKLNPKDMMNFIQKFMAVSNANKGAV